MKARALNAALPSFDDLAHLEERLIEAFRQVLEAAAKRAAGRFERVADLELVAAPGVTSHSAMVAVYPTAEQQALLARPGGEDPDIIHCTLAFLGEVEPDQAEKAAAIIRRVALDHMPLEGEVGGIASFGDNGDGHPSILLPDVNGLAELRHAVCEALDAEGVWYSGTRRQLESTRASADVGGAGGEASRRDDADGAGLPDLASDPVEEVRDGEGLGTADRGAPDRLDAYPGADPGRDGRTPRLRDEALPERRAHASEDEVGARAGALADPGDLLDSRDAVRAAGREGMGSLSSLREGREQALQAAAGSGKVHGWLPHLTLDYTEEPSPPPAHLIGRPLSFGQLSVAVGDVRRDYDLGGGLTAAGGSTPPWLQPHPDELVDVEALIRQFRTKADPIRRSVIEEVSGPALAAAGLSFDVTNPFISGVFGKIGQHITYIAETTRLNAMRIVRRSYDEGLTIPDTAKAIQAGMAAASATRATLIARTEMTSLVNGSSLAATRIIDSAISEARDAGEEDAQEFVGYHKRWMTAPGAPFPRHEDYEGLDGQTVPLEAPFDVGGVQLMFPGDPDGPPEEVCNCRCVLAYVDAGGEETEAEEGDGGMAAAADALPSIDEPEGGVPVSGRAEAETTTTPEADVLAAGAEAVALAEAQQEMTGECANCQHDAEMHAGAMQDGPCTADGCDCEGFVAERVDETDLGNSGNGSNGMTAYVRIRPELDPEFHATIADATERALTEGYQRFADGMPEVPVLDVRPDRAEPTEVEQPVAAGKASQQKWQAVLAPEGKTTDDGRVFAPGSITWRDVPLSLMAMIETSEGGHVGATLSGRIDRIWRDDSGLPALIRAEGVFDDSDFGGEIARLVGDRTLRGNSVDLAIRVAEIGPREAYVDENGYWLPDAPLAPGQVPMDDPEMLFSSEGLMVVYDAIIGMSTVCPFPAFADGEIVLAAATETTPEFGVEEVGKMRWRIWLVDAFETEGDVVTAAASGAVPEKPPAEWFDQPDLGELTPLTVTDDGQVFGHAWAWDVCHIGIPGACTVAPHSHTDYAYFHLKEVETDDGARVACGTITLGTGHADRRASRQAATEHYDNTGAAVADVRVYEDEFGGCVAGALRPEIPAGRIRELRGSTPSGDWRKVGGNLELVGLLAVNVPGFPVPRTRALVASGEGLEEVEVLTLLSAGVLDPNREVEVEAIDDGSHAKLRALAARARGGLQALAELAAAPRDPAGAPDERTSLERARAALVASGIDPDVERDPVTATYELTQGSAVEKAFLSAALADGMNETRRATWPSEATLAEHGEIIVRDEHEATFRLDDGTLCYAHVCDGWARFRVASASRARTDEALSAFSTAYPPLYLTLDERQVVPITFWTLGRFGPQSRMRMIESASLDDIGGNYPAAVRDELARLADGFQPGKDGQLLLWQGPPGTGKTWALRALASAWSSWAEFSYITDPDQFFVSDPAYMIDVLLQDSYETLTVAGDLVSEGDPGGKWRILILEDTGELLSANAKEAYGQGLSRLLNVVDGMVGQGLRVLAIVTTNDELGDLHPAAVRPGRCASQISFGPLDAEEASSWLGEMVDEPLTLAELYERRGTAQEALAEADVPARDHPDDPEPEDARDLMAAAD